MRAFVLTLLLAWLLSAALCWSAPNGERTSRFSQQTLATDLAGGYQVVACDLNRDGKPDLIALGSNITELVWFENPQLAAARHRFGASAHDQRRCMGY